MDSSEDSRSIQMFIGALSLSNRLVPMASSSSMKMIAGAFSLANSKASRNQLDGFSSDVRIKVSAICPLRLYPSGKKHERVPSWTRGRSFLPCFLPHLDSDIAAESIELIQQLQHGSLNLSVSGLITVESLGATLRERNMNESQAGLGAAVSCHAFYPCDRAWLMFSRADSLGKGNSIFRSRRPDRSKAGSRISIRLVATFCRFTRES
jgi:hypothetical protein